MDPLTGPEMPLKEFVGYIWIQDNPGIRLRLLARTLNEARDAVVAEHGEGHVIFICNEDDAARPRGH